MSELTPIGSIADTFQVCPKLNTLKLQFLNTSDGFYRDMHHSFPNLTNLSIQDGKFDLNLFTQIARMSKLESLQVIAYFVKREHDFHDDEEDDVLRKLKIERYEEEVGHDRLNQFITNCSPLCGHNTLRTIEFVSFYSSSCSIQSLHQIINFASTIPAPSFKFTFCNSEYDDVTWNPDFYRIMCQQISGMSIPENLTISLNHVTRKHNQLIYEEIKYIIMNGRVITF
jgi:hypothetical protein